MDYASIDEAHDGLWLCDGPNGMMMNFDEPDFSMEQEEEWQCDITGDLNEFGETALKREEEFVQLNIETIEQVAISLENRGLHLASGVSRRVVSNQHPHTVRITRMKEVDMQELIAQKKEGNQLFVAKQYQEALEKYDDALLAVDYLYVAPKDQVKEVVNIISNQVECHLRLHEYQEAAGIATDALVIDANHKKTRIRRAKAELALYKKENKWTCLAQACHDLEDILDSPFADTLASETAQNLLNEANVCLEQERITFLTEKPNVDFDFTIRSFKSKCW